MITTDKLSLGDFIKHLATALQLQQIKMPLEDERRWHLLFYELKKVGSEKPAFFEALRFDWDGPYPRCNRVSEFLQALHWNTSVSAMNPGFKEFMFPADVIDDYSRREEVLDPDVRTFLAQAVETAKQEFK